MFLIWQTHHAPRQTKQLWYLQHTNHIIYAKYVDSRERISVSQKSSFCPLNFLFLCFFFCLQKVGCDNKALILAAFQSVIFFCSLNKADATFPRINPSPVYFLTTFFSVYLWPCTVVEGKAIPLINVEAEGCLTCVTCVPSNLMQKYWLVTSVTGSSWGTT